MTDNFDFQTGLKYLSGQVKNMSDKVDNIIKDLNKKNRDIELNDQTVNTSSEKFSEQNQMYEKYYALVDYIMINSNCLNKVKAYEYEYMKYLLKDIKDITVEHVERFSYLKHIIDCCYDKRNLKDIDNLTYQQLYGLITNRFFINNTTFYHNLYMSCVIRNARYFSKIKNTDISDVKENIKKEEDEEIEYIDTGERPEKDLYMIDE